MAVIPRQWIAPFELAFSLLKDWGKPRSNEPLNPFAASAAPGPELPGAVNLPTEVDFTTHADERLAQEGRVHSDEEEEEIRQRVQQMAEQHKLFDQQKLLQNIKRVGIITHEIPKGDSRHNTDGNRILTIMSPKQKKQIGHPLDGKLIPTVKTTFPIYHNPRHPKRIWDIAQNKGLTHIIDMTGTHPLQQNKLHKVMGGGKRLKGEPMDLAWRLLKTPVTPEAKRHKLEYDKKYQDNPKRVKYREELNRERRQRGVYGKGGKDMSHTKDGKIVPEDASKNRARHFKGRGTLKSFILVKR